MDDEIPDGTPDHPSETPAADDAASSESASVPSLGRAIAAYTLIRVGLIVAVTVVLMLVGHPFGLPLIVALAFAVVLQLPLAVLMFGKQRRELTAALARAKSRRTRERDRMWAELTGEERPE